MPKNSIDKIHDNPLTDDRIVFDSEDGPSEVIIRRDGDIVICRENNPDSAAKAFTRGIERALESDDDMMMRKTMSRSILRKQGKRLQNSAQGFWQT
jgi:hypothetical protein